MTRTDERVELQGVMTAQAGVLRSAESLAVAGEAVRAIDTDDREVANLVTVAEALCLAAAAREETRGAHARRDFPDVSSQWQRRIVVRM